MNKTWRKVLTLLVIVTMALGIIGPVQSKAANYNWWTGTGTLYMVSKLDEEVKSGGYTNIASALSDGYYAKKNADGSNDLSSWTFSYEAAAIKVDMKSKKDGIVQLRLAQKSGSQSVSVRVIREKDYYTAASLTGKLQLSYSNATSSDSSVQGYATQSSSTSYVHDGTNIWNVALEGGQDYYFIVERYNDSAFKGLDYDSISYQLVYKEADNQGSKSTVTLKNGDKKYEFYTLTYPKHEYVFTAPAYSSSTVYMAFDGETAEKKGTAKVEVYNENGEQIGKTQSYNGSEASMKKEFALNIDDKDRAKAHTYTIKISGLFGNGTIRLEQNLGRVTANVGSSSDKGYEVTLDIKNIDVSTIRYLVNAPYDNLEESDAAWSSSYNVDKNTGKFYAKENGHYVVRVTDKNNKKYFCEFDIDSIDNEPPTIDLNKYYRHAVKITHSSKDSDISTMTVDGFEIVDGAIIAEEGIHTTVFADKSGNKTERQFIIDRTLPVFQSDTIRDGGTLSAVGNHSFKVSDSVSEIKYVKVDGVNKTNSYDGSYSVYISDYNTRHEIEIADGSGNVITIAFMSPKSNNGGGNGGNGGAGTVGGGGTGTGSVGGEDNQEGVGTVGGDGSYDDNKDDEKQEWTVGG